MKAKKSKSLEKKSSENKLMSGITGVYVMLMCSIYLLYTGSGGYEHITQSKFVLFTVLTAGYVGISLLLRLELVVVGAAEPGGFKNVVQCMPPAGWLMLGYAVITVVSALCSEYRSLAVWGGVRREGAVTIILYVLCAVFIAVSYVPSWKHITVFAAAVSLNCILAFVQIAGYNPFGLYPEGMSYADAFVKYSGEFLGTVGNVDQMAAVLCIAIPLFIMSMIRMKSRYRFLLAVPLLLSTVLLFMEKVQAGILGVLAGVVLSLPLVCRLNRKKRRDVYVIILVVVLVFLAVIYCAGAQLPGSLNELSQIMHGNFDDSYATGRLYIWKNTLPLVPEHVILGGGPDTLSMRLDAGFSRFNEAIGQTVTSSIDAAHNEYLNVLVNQGIIALIFYIAALLALAWRWVRESDRQAITAVCGSAILAYCIQAFFGISCLVSAPYLWIVVGIMINDSYTERKAALK